VNNVLKILLFLFLITLSRVKAEEFRIEIPEASDGFPSNLVYKIYQDSKGFIWFGTMYGLYRYDGVNYVSYRYNPMDSTSIGNDDVVSIFEDSKGNMWFGTYMGGANLYDPVTSKFTRFVYSENKNSLSDNTVWSIAEDKEGAMWFGTQNGLNKFQNNRFTVYQNINGNTNSNVVFSLACDKENNLWIGTMRGGLLRLNAQRSIFENYKRYDNSADSLNGNFIRGLYCDKKGNILIGMLQRGVCMLTADDIKRNVFRFNKQLFDSTNVNSPGNVNVMEIAEDNKGNYVFASGNNLYKYNTQLKSFSKTNLSASVSSKPEVVSLMYDYSGCVWISSYENCLYKAKEESDNFKNISKADDGSLIGSVSSICKLNEDVFIGSANGLFRYSRNNNKIENVKTTSIANVTALLNDEGKIYIGTPSGLLKLSGSKEEFVLKNISVTSLISGESKIIAGTLNGLYFINKNSFDTIAFRKIEGDGSSLNDNLILSVYKDLEGNIWAGTYAGLNKFESSANKFIHYTKNLNDTTSLSNNYVYCMNQFSADKIFIGTAGGVNVFYPKENRFSLLKEKHLENSVINSVLNYKNDIWFGANRGLVSYNSISGDAVDFKKDDGIENEFFNPGAMLSSDEEIIAGSKSGITLFSPELIKRDTSKPLISFCGMKIFNGKDISKIDLSHLNEVKTDYQENNLEIDFALMDFTNPKKNQYEYFLVGADENWISSGNKNSVFYSNLNPGSYTLKIRGINPNGIRSDEKSLHLVITPPYWKTIWFYCLVFFITGSLLFILYKYRVRKNVQLALTIEKAKEEERDKWREQASIDYHDELGHKLTRISMFSRRVLKKMNGSVNEWGNDLNNIIETSDSLRSSARDLIWSLNPSEDTLIDFITRINIFGEEFYDGAEMKFHKCKIHEEWKNIRLNMDTKRQMLFIIKEAMNNSLKYSNAKNVYFNIDAGEYITVKISDDGKGFIYPSEYTGYGITNMSKRAERTGFNLEIISSQGNGTEILISGVKYITSKNKIEE
jgi:ligand-binding sensor domain-containing protein